MQETLLSLVEKISVADNEKWDYMHAEVPNLLCDLYRKQLQKKSGIG